MGTVEKVKPRKTTTEETLGVTVETPINPATNSPSISTGTSGNGGGDAGTTAAKEIIAKRRGRPPGSTNNKPATPNESQTAALAQMEALHAQLFSSENFEALVSMPGDLGFALTGNEHWFISDKERKVLSSTGSVACRFLGGDPKWIAISLFAMALVSAYGGRAMKELFIRKQKKNAPKENKAQSTDAS